MQEMSFPPRTARRRAGAAVGFRGLRFRMRPVCAAVCLLVTGVPALALPQGATVVQGQASIASTVPGQLAIVQATDKAAIDWRGFSIGLGEQVRIAQPAVTSVLLNRVTGADPSLLLGQLQSNGRVFLTNPRGIVFGAGSRIDVGGLVATTLDISDDALRGGRLQLTQGTQPPASITSAGVIDAAGGTVALVAPTLTQSGRISASRVGLAAASAVTVDVEGDGLVFFDARNDGMAARLKVLGEVRADGGTAELRAVARSGFADTVLNLDGIVRARTIGEHAGRIVIDGGPAGSTQVSGRVDASGALGARGGEVAIHGATLQVDAASVITTSGGAGGTVQLQADASGDAVVRGSVLAQGANGAGGRVEITGGRVGLFDQARVDASGTRAGGDVRIGGDFQGGGALQRAQRTEVGRDASIAADAHDRGDGGRVIVWSDGGTRFDGRISAAGGAQGGQGGFVETSGKAALGITTGRVDVHAAHGAGGTWLLDPTDITVDTGAAAIADYADVSSFTGSMGAQTVAPTTLDNVGGNVQLQATHDITVSSDLALTTSGASLKMTALHAIHVNADVSTTNGSITLTAGQTGSSGGITLASGKTIDAGNAKIALDANGGNVTLAGALATTNASTTAIGITDADDLQLGDVSSGAAGTITLSFTGSGTQQTGSAISGGRLVKQGSGTLTLDKSNGYTGGTSVADGTLRVTGATGKAGASSGDIDIAAGATLDLRSAAVLANDVNNAGGTIGNSAGSATLSGDVTLKADGTFDSTGTKLTLSGVVGESGGSWGVNKTGDGTVVLSNVNTYTGATLVEGGTLSVASTGSVAASSAVSVASGAQLDFADDSTIASLSGAGTVDIGGHTLTLGDTANTTFSGSIDGTGGKLEKTGSGRLVLSGTNGYTGGTTVSAGTLRLDGPDADAGSGDITVAAGAALDLRGAASVSSQVTLDGGSITSSGGGGTLSGDVTLTAASTVSAGSGSVLALDGVVDDAAASFKLTKTGSGTVTLSQANTYDGGTAVNGGILSISGTNATAGTGAIGVAAGATLDIGGGATVANAVNVAGGTIANGSGAGTLSGTTTLSADTTFTVSGSGLTVSGAIGDGGSSRSITKEGNKQLTFSAANTYGGATAIEDGTLRLSGAAATAGGGAIAVASGATLDLAGGASAANAVSLAGGKVNNSSGTGSLSGVLTLTADSTLGSAGAGLTVGGVIGGAGFGITKTGSGTVTLGAANTYTGATQVDAGTLATTGADRIANASDVTVGAGATLALGGNEIIASLSGEGAVTLGANTLTVGDSGSTSFDGVIDGLGGSLVKQGSGTLTLTAANSYSGGTSIGNGTLRLSGAAAKAGSGAITVAAAHTLDISDGANVGNAVTLAGGHVGNGSGTGTLSGTTTLSANSTFESSGTGLAVSGAIGEGSPGLGIAKSGSGTVTLSGTNTYTGATLVNAGTLATSGAERVADASAVTVASLATLDLGGNEAIASLAGAGTVKMHGHTLSVGGDNSSSSFSGVLGGSGGSLSKLGSGTFTLSGSSTYSGATTVAAGTLATTGSGRLSAASAVDVALGATLDLAGDETVGSLAGAGSVTLAGTLAAGADDTSTSFTGAISGGTLAKEGAGTLSLGGTAISAGLDVDAGTVVTTSAHALSATAAVSVADGATLTLAGDETVASLALAGTLDGSGTVTAASYALDGGTANLNLGAGTLTSTGASTLDGTAAAGSVAVNGGTLTLVGADRLASDAAVTVATGAKLTLGGAQTIGSLGGAGNVVLGANTLTTGAGGSSTFGGSLSGTGGLIKQGGATTFTLNGHNTYTGATTVKEGTLDVGGKLDSTTLNVQAAAAMATTAAHRLAATSTLNVAAGATVTLAGDETVSALALSGTLDGSGTLSAATVALDGASVSTDLDAGALSSTGTSVLDGDAAADTVDVNGGTLTLVGAHRLASDAAVTVAASATLGLGGDETIGSLAGGGGVNLGAHTLATGQTASSTFSGTLTGSGGLTKQGALTTFTLSGSNTYTGTTTVAAGSLKVGGTLASKALSIDAGKLITTAAHRLSSAAVVDVATGATLTLAGDETVHTLALAGTLDGSGTLTADSVAFDGGTAELGLDTTTLSSTGASVLAGDATASTIDVDGGTLTLVGAHRLASNAAVTVATGAALGLGGDETIGSLAGAGNVALGSHTLATGSAASSTFAGRLSGSGRLAKQGTGTTFTLSGNNTYSGGTTIEGGTLAVGQGGHSGSIGSGAVVNDGVLRFTRNDTLAVASAISGSGSLQQTGTGTLVLTGANSYAGKTTVSAGVLQVGDGGTHGSVGTGAVIDNGVLRFMRSDDLSVAGSISGSGALQQAGSGVLTLAADNTYGGATTVAAGGTLQVGTGGSSGSLGAGAVVVDGVLRFERADDVLLAKGIGGSGSLQQAGSGTLTLAATNSYSGGTRIDAGTLEIGRGGTSGSMGGGPIVNNATLRFNRSDKLVLGAALGGAGRLQQAGTGTLVLTGNNTYSGGTQVLDADGVLQVGDGGASGSLGAGPVTIAGTLRFDRTGTVVVNNAIAGSGALEQAGSGTLVLRGANRYGGATRVKAGTLRTDGDERLPDTTAVSVASAAHLVLGGNETLASLHSDGAVELQGSLGAGRDLLLRGAVTIDAASPLTLTAQDIAATNDGNDWGSQPLSITASSLALSSGLDAGGRQRDLALGSVTLAQGGRIDAGTLHIADTLALNGGTLELHAHAVPTYSVLPRETRKSVAGEPLAFAANVVTQADGSRITTLAGSTLTIQAERGGSIALTQDANDFAGGLNVLSGAEWNTAWSSNPVMAGKVHAAGQSQLLISADTLVVGEHGLEGDVIALRANRLGMQGSDGLIAARMPYNDENGTTGSAPGLTLELAPGAFGVPFAFGSPKGGELRVSIGGRDIGARSTGPDAGYLRVLPKGGARGATAIYLTGPRLVDGYDFFNESAAEQGEVPVLYNGVLPQTPQVAGSLSAVAAMSESARKDRFEEAVRTENVAVRLRAGVIVEVGPGRPATQGSEGLLPPESCTPAPGSLQCE